jgi:predicted aconitase
VYLNKEEEAALNGEFGEANQIAYSLLIDVGEFYEADKLIPIHSTHISGVSYLTGGDGLIDQLELFASKNAQVKVYSTLNPCGMDRNDWENHFIDLEFATKQFKILKFFEEMGVTTTCSCTPYDFGHLLSKGQHVAWAESSAITFANSFFGARTNKEDALTVLAAAITGKAINYGFHLTENRLPNVLVNVEADVLEYSDYSILGEVVGKAFNKINFQFGAIPFFKGLKNPRPQDLKSLGAALASFGTQLFHAENITPEIEIYEKTTRADVTDEITITSSMIHDMYESLKPNVIPNITVIGCPNANLEEIRTLTELTNGRKLKVGKEFWLFTNRAQKAQAESAGYIKRLHKAGVKVLVDTCPEVTPYDKKRFSSILTNSIKAQHYISAPSLNGIPTYLLPVKKCVEEMFE